MIKDKHKHVRLIMKGKYVVEVVPYRSAKKKGKYFLRPKAPNGRILNHEYNSLRSALKGAKLMTKLRNILVKKTIR